MFPRSTNPRTEFLEVANEIDKKGEKNLLSALEVYQQHNYLPCEDCPLTTDRNMIREIGFREALLDLSSSAKTVLKIIFDTPADLTQVVMESADKALTLARIKRYMTGHLGWTRNRTQQSINEIRDVLRSDSW